MSLAHPRILRLASLLTAGCIALALIVPAGVLAQTVATAPAAAAKPNVESLDNPYGLKAMIEHGNLRILFWDESIVEENPHSACYDKALRNA